ncbi:hypothetical protein Tco_0649905, partial [Tanacetum coccineum]
FSLLGCVLLWTVNRDSAASDPHLVCFNVVDSPGRWLVDSAAAWLVFFASSGCLLRFCSKWSASELFRSC